MHVKVSALFQIKLTTVEEIESEGILVASRKYEYGYDTAQIVKKIKIKKIETSKQLLSIPKCFVQCNIQFNSLQKHFIHP